MTALVALVASAAALNGLLAGISIEVALVKLPARRRIGAVAYAAFARASDLGNGLWLYPSLAVGAALATLAAGCLALVTRQPTGVLLSLGVACATSIGHFVATAKAAPAMLLVGKAPADEALIARLLDRFARWHALRAALQVLTFLAAMWAMLLL